jgi:hypothetical protein
MKVAGAKPETSPSLSDNAAEFTALVNKIWDNPNVSSKPVEAVLAETSVQKDVDIIGAKSKILYVHRQIADTDLYWLDNRSDDLNEATISFRVTGKVPQWWHPQTGKMEKVSYQIKDGRTIVPLKFESWEAYFIVFDNKTTVASYTKPAMTETEVAVVKGDWKLTFQEGRGAPAQATFNALASLTDHADPGIKYFSGTATYENTITLPAVGKNPYILDLGDVKNIAEVTVNGKSMGTVWKKPFRIDITGALKSGNNTVSIKVTNLWVNRLIGDAQPGVTSKITFTTMPFYKADSPLLSSGLLGPVRLLEAKTTAK